MSIDIKWIILVAACIAVLVLVRKREEWRDPILVAVGVATVLITILFFVATPVVTLHR
jgi:hypothetical protein